MASFMRIDDAQFQTFVKRVGNKVEAKEIVHDVGNGMRKLAAESTRKVKARTPVDTGNLRGGWSTSGMNYAGAGFSFTLENNVEYAPFVENGHRTRGGKGWVNGQFFLKKTVVEIQGEFPEIWQPIFDKALRGLFG
ncbi:MULTISPECIES: HK97 gp10 family phage protein [Lentilactobacillus]|jgi:hypothetical protein|uniref:HK97 gp10 family phage protein n=1 Tax=Lentilactobacillus hilgardii TaxID=1588 RepID=A0A6P1EET8_LENHI|nr:MULTISPECIES: HK97 gp10 family phage protein [Lentilactobacillus]MCC6101815.1 HK97 gp10 family phage protein [Lactobacillus sp.]DAP86707.1 MAG TPA: type I neck protein [Caudoviricetes sp.]ORM98105.1 hypothetical protein FAM21809_00083 [Lentilactobacillus parabuchneri]ORN13282.1 hypothetical protein FAM23164_02238 [Lentilactobacillus parabuchneri]ORN18686.1 hypothetical protein FAM23166_02057 [Lentilactobacillus parabuchneri]